MLTGIDKALATGAVQFIASELLEHFHVVVPGETQTAIATGIAAVIGALITWAIPNASK